MSQRIIRSTKRATECLMDAEASLSILKHKGKPLQGKKWWPARFNRRSKAQKHNESCGPWQRQRVNVSPGDGMCS